MIEERIFTVLELPKVLARLSTLAASEAGRSECLALRPYSTLVSLNTEAEFFTQGQLWLEHTGFKITFFPDLSTIWNMLESSAKILDLDGLWGIRQVLRQAEAMRESLLTGGTGKADSPVTENWLALKARCVSVVWPSSSMQALNRCLSDDGQLRDEASPELKLIRIEVRRLHQQCTRKVKDFSVQYNIAHFLQDDFITLSSDRYVLPLKSNFKGRLQGVIHDYSQTGETCYFEPLFLVEINNRLQELKQEEREEEHKILRYISELLKADLPGLRALYGFLIDTDVLQAKVALSRHYDGRLVRFEDNDNATMNLLEARHPLLAITAMDALVAQSGKQASPDNRKQQAVPMDLVLQPGQKALVISGGNAGGKTVCLKTLGLNALMGMCALPVPVGKGSSLPFWSTIHPFIGDEQSLEDHVSTFTAQIEHLSAVLRNVDHNSLILLDEFGAGTDPAQGAALAQAVVDELLEQGAFVVAATHFPALKAYALSKPAVRAASVLFDPNTKRPLFRLAYDQVGASQALDAAREHGLPEKLLKRAEQYLLMDGEDTSTLISRLNSLAVEREKEIDSLKTEQDKFKQKREKLAADFEKKRQALFSDIQLQAESVLKDWKAARVTHKQALKNLSQLRKSLHPGSGAALGLEATEATTPSLNVATLISGQQVLYAPWERKAEVVEVDARRQKVRLDLSGVTLWADAADIRTQDVAATAKPPKKDAAKTEMQSGFTGQLDTNYALRLDLRGKRADFAISELISFLDSAVLSGRDMLEIVHGRGTGALRREVHLALKNFPMISSFKLAPEDQGGDGVTIVQIK